MGSDRLDGAALSAAVAAGGGLGGVVLSASGPARAKPVVDREAGIVYGIPLLTLGLANPCNAPPFIVDAETLAGVAAAVNTAPNPIRSRLTHPDIDPRSDGLPWTFGSVRNAVLEPDRVLVDLHVGDFAAHSPNGNLREFILGLAEEEPANAGLSIVIEDGRLIAIPGADHPVARIESLFAADLVGEPAGNAHGMLKKRREPSGLLPPGPALQAANQAEGTVTMEWTQAQMEYLHGLGLPADAGPEAVQAFVDGLTPEQKAELEKLAAAAGVPGGAASGGSGPAGDPVGSGNAALAAGTSAARAHLQALREVGRIARLGDSWAADQFNAGATIQEAQRAALAASSNARPRQPLPMGARVSVGANLAVDGLPEAIMHGIMLRAGRQVENPHARSSEFRHLPLNEMGRRFLCAVGLPAESWPRDRIARACLSRNGLNHELRRAALTAGDYSSFLGTFSNILADTMGKSLIQSYKTAPKKWPKFCSKAMAQDFKTQDANALGTAPPLTATTPGDLVVYAAMTDRKEQWALTTYTAGAVFTFQQWVNDDLGAFGLVPQKMGVKAAQKEDSLAFAVLSGNPAMADSTTLFHADHGNLAASGGAMSVTTLQAGYAAIAAQNDVGASGDPMDLEPGLLIVPAALSATARQLVYGAVDPASSGAAANPYEGRLEVIESARLTGTAWYLAVRPGLVAESIALGFLDGSEEPLIDSEEDFDSNVIKWKVVHHVVAKALDWRGVYKNPGA